MTTILVGEEMEPLAVSNACAECDPAYLHALVLYTLSIAQHRKVIHDPDANEILA